MVGVVEDDDVTTVGRPESGRHLIDKDPVINLQGLHHRARWDVERTDDPSFEGGGDEYGDENDRCGLEQATEKSLRGWRWGSF